MNPTEVPGMANNNKVNKIKIDFAGAAFVTGVFVLIVLFWGEPDLHEALMHRLMDTPRENITLIDPLD